MHSTKLRNPHALLLMVSITFVALALALSFMGKVVSALIALAAGLVMLSYAFASRHQRQNASG